MPTYTARRGWQRVLQARIPTLFGLGILVLGVVVGIILLGQGTTGFLPRASEDSVPRNIRITNITDTGFSVSFLTDVASAGYLEYGTTPSRTNVQVRDDRDQLANTVGSFTTHHVTVRGLQPTTQYYFRLGTGSGAAFDNNGQPFAVRTARAVAPGGEARTAYGTVNTEVGNPADGAIVYITIQGASPLSAQVKANGSWALPLSGVRTLDLSSSITVDDTTPIKVEVQGTRRTDTLQLDTTGGQVMPLQTLQFGQSVTSSPDTSTNTNPDTTTDTTNSGSGEGGETTGTGGANGFGSLYNSAEGTQAAPVNDVDIRLQNQETVNTTQPEFQGVAPSGQYVQIEVHSTTPYYGVAQAGTDGQWSWSPPADLEPGEHTITVTYVDEQGKSQQVQRTFLVQATGANTPAFTSTPSASTATPTPTPNLIAQATPVPTPLPTLPPTPTATPSAIPIATTSAQPVSGSIHTTIFLMILALACFGVGGGLTAWAWVRPLDPQE